MRFSELRTVIGGISQKMLTTTLRNPGARRLRDAHRFRDDPARVDYELTDLGRELLVPVNALGDWARDNIGAHQRGACASSTSMRRDAATGDARSRATRQLCLGGTGFGLPPLSSATMTKSASVTFSMRSDR